VGGQWGERSAARSPPAGVVEEASDLRIRVSGFGFEGLYVRGPRRGEVGGASTTKNVAVYDGDFLSWISEKSS
jgi:hypothetical protein